MCLCLSNNFSKSLHKHKQDLTILSGNAKLMLLIIFRVPIYMCVCEFAVDPIL